jgi:hypothetical protein
MKKYKAELVRIGKISGMLYQVEGAETSTLVIYGIGAPLSPDSGNLPDTTSILNHNVDLLVPDYIGYGRSEGDFTPVNCIRTFLVLYDQLTKGCVAKSNYKNTEYKLKYRRIIIIGKSFAGAYIPLLPRYDKRIKELCAICPVLDWTRCGRIDGEETIKGFMNAMELDGYKHLYRGICSKTWEKHFKNEDSLSPIKNIKYLDRVKLFIGHGMEDKNIHYSNSVRYYEKLIKQHPTNEYQYKLRLYKHCDHSSATSNRAVNDYMKWINI